MTATKIQTAFLRAIIAGGDNFMYWMVHDSNTFPTNVYNTLRNFLISAETAYGTQSLTLTNLDDSTELADGIDSFPIPPSK